MFRKKQPKRHPDPVIEFRLERIRGLMLFAKQLQRQTGDLIDEINALNKKIRWLDGYNDGQRRADYAQRAAELQEVIRANGAQIEAVHQKVAEQQAAIDESDLAYL